MKNEALNMEMLEVLQAIQKYWQEDKTAPLYPDAQLFDTDVAIREVVGFVVAHTTYKAELNARQGGADN